MNNKLKVLLCTAMVLMTTHAFAQGYKITAKTFDASNGDIISFATASLSQDDAQKNVKHVLSSADGDILFEHIRKGNYTIKVELMGYKPYSRKLKVESDLNLGRIELEVDAQVLEGATVTAVGNPITVKKDTIEYNVTMIKSSDNDMLIDLLKKLPGIEVDSDGSITANGKTINKITIDGKTFFLNDPQLATKNIPSKIIEKVKVVDKKSDQALFTGIDDGEEETIIDLGVRKGMFKGWFGNVMGGGGHDVPSPQNDMNDWRYQGAGFIGNFTENQQISIILNGNNTNNRGFNDLAGSMMGGMRGGRGGRGRDEGGITTSWMGGINGAWNLFDNNMELASNYLYNGSIKDIEKETDKITYTSESESLGYHSKDIDNTFTNGHRFGVRMDHKFSDNTSLLFEPQFNFGNGTYSEISEFYTDRINNATEETQRVNEGTSNSFGANKNWNASGYLLFRQRLGKPGRTMTINARYDFSNNYMSGVIDNMTTSYNEGEPSEEITFQNFDQKRVNSSLTGGITYTEPLYNNVLFLEANYNYTWNNQNSYKDTYDLDKYNTDYSEWNATYSNSIDNTAHNHRAGVNLMYQKDKFNMQLGFNANPTTTHNVTKNADSQIDTTYTTVKWSPQVSMRYDLNDNSNLRFFYWGRSNQPSTSQLMPVPDNSDPLNISLGNPYLLPYFSHNIRGMFRYTNRKSFTSVNAFLNSGITQNPIINTSWYDESGRQFSLPSNGPAAFNASLRVMVNSPIGKSKFSIFNMFNINYNNSSNYIKTGNSLDMDNYYVDGIFDYALFHDKVQTTSLWDDNFAVNLNQTLGITERVRFTYRDEKIEVNVGARTRMNKGFYTIAQGNTNTTWATQVEGSFNWTIGAGFNLIGEYSYNRYDGYTTPQADAHVLNAEITKLLFKKTVTLGIKGYDLLGMSRNLSVTDAANYHMESRNNTLGRYIIVSLTYRFGNMNKFQEGMGGRGGHGPYGGGRR